jgi:hypothetical protein
VVGVFLKVIAGWAWLSTAVCSREERPSAHGPSTERLGCHHTNTWVSVLCSWGPRTRPCRSWWTSCRR